MTTRLKYLPGDAGYSFARSSEAYYRNSSGTWTLANEDELRDAHYLSGVRYTLLEGPHNQYLANTGSPATQSQTLPAGNYICWLEGSGNVVLSGGTSGTVTEGAGFVDFWLSSEQSVTFTCSGTITRFNCQRVSDFGSYSLNTMQPTSYINTGATPPSSRGYEPFYWSWTPTPEAMTVLLDFNAHALGGDLNHLFRFGDVGANKRFAATVRGDSWTMGCEHYGTSLVQSGATSVGCSPGDRVWLRCILNSDGSCQPFISVNSGSEQSGSASSANALQSTWGSTPRFGMPWESTLAQYALRGALVETGIVSRDAMLAILYPTEGQTILPNATVADGGWSVTGAATRHEALADESASSYVTSPANPQGTEILKLGLTDISDPGAGDVTFDIDAQQV